MNKELYDLTVVGGGAAGIMAGIIASRRGFKVCLLEKNDRLGKKLLITGKGRCNITNYETDIHKFVENYGKNGKFLYSSLDKLGVEETVRFFNEIGLTTKVERGNRVFPKSDSSLDVHQCLMRNLKKNSVAIFTGEEVKDIDRVGEYCGNTNVFRVLTKVSEFFSRNLLISTGGMAFPGTGSTGDGYNWSRKFGHKIVELNPSLVSLHVKEVWVKDLEGLSLKNVLISLMGKDKVLASRFGEAIFTDCGLSGPIILDLSREAVILFKRGEKLKLLIDLKPALSREVLNSRILKDFCLNKRKVFKNSLGELLPKSLIPVVINLCGINAEKKVSEITKKERAKLVHVLKNIELNISGHDDYKNAIVTSGGISLKEVNPKTLESKLCENLYFAGEILDIDGPTGGHNLQMCWSTGYTVGDAIR